MGDAGIIRFPGNLDPRAQEFRPNNNLNNLAPPQIPFSGQPSQDVCYLYAPLQATPFCDGAATVVHLGGYSQYPAPPHGLPPCVMTVPPLPPPSTAPTRALLVSSVARDVSETMIRRELEVFGEVRGVEMERLCDGIVTVHFYDLRHAEMALKEIQEQHLLQQSRISNFFGALQLSQFDGRRSMVAPPPPQLPARGLIAGCAVWAQFIIPACNAVPDGINQGTIVVFNLDPNVSSSCLREIFQAFGVVKELRETPMKKQQRFVEYYDVRDAAKALREMNGKEIYGKHVVIEFSRPGGYGGKFFNAGTKGFSTHNNNNSNNNTIFNNKKIFKYAPPRPPLPACPRPPPSQPVGPCNVPPRPFPNQPQYPTTKKASNSSKANPNDENANQKETSIDATLSLSSGGLAGDVIVEKIAADGLPKRNARKDRSQSSSATAKQQQSRSRQWKGKQLKKLDTRFLINEDAVVESNCIDSRTTLMIKNIPNKYSQKLLLNMLDNHCIHCNEQIANGDDHPLSSYDFVYLPIDFNNKCNVGYGFVNMTSPQAAWRLYKAFHHHHWEVFNSRKICEVTYARVQGLEALKDHFKDSKFPCEMMDHYLPAVFTPPRDGKHLTEPLPIVSHKKQHVLIKFTDLDDEVDGGDALNNGDDADQEVEQEAEENLNSSSSSLRNGGGDAGDDDKDCISDRMMAL